MLEQWIDTDHVSDIVIFGGWLIRLGALIIIPFRRDPLAAKGWLILIFFMPYVGLLAFIILGRVVVSDEYAYRILNYPIRARGQVDFLKDLEVREFPVESPGSIAFQAKYLRALGPFAPVTGNDVEILADYDDSLLQMAKAIESAKEHMHMVFYIFFKDSSTEPIVHAIQKAAQRGVECRILLDSYGCQASWRQLVAELEPFGVKMHEMNPIGKILRRVGRFDIRSHEKMLIIDGKVAFTGSQNLVSRTAQSGVVYEDLMVKLHGPVVSQLQMLFFADWWAHTDELVIEKKYFPAPDIRGQVTALTVPSGPAYKTQYHHRLLVELIYSSRRRIGITTPYFIPDAALLQALQSAVLRGVQVDLMISQKTDNDFVDWAQRSYFEELLEWGVKIHHYPQRFLHSKFLTFDDTFAFVGTTNMDIRSFQLNAELGILVQDKEITGQLVRLEEKQMKAAQALDIQSWRERPLKDQFLENVTRLFSSVL